MQELLDRLFNTLGQIQAHQKSLVSLSNFAHVGVAFHSKHMIEKSNVWFTQAEALPNIEDMNLVDVAKLVSSAEQFLLELRKFILRARIECDKHQSSKEIRHAL